MGRRKTAIDANGAHVCHHSGVTVKDALLGSLLPAADAETLLACLLQKGRSWLVAHSDASLTPMQWERWIAWVARRKNHEPVAYITQQQEFYGRHFSVDHRVLIPRPATEGVVEMTLAFLHDGKEREEEVDAGIVVCAQRISSGEKFDPQTIVDVGTGSGCIAITLALERPRLHVIATDISSDALDVARINADHHGVLERITFTQGDGLAAVWDLSEPFLLVSNPPYIPEGRELMKDVKDFEPSVALFGGRDGRAVARKLRNDAAEHPFCQGWVMEGESELSFS